MSASAHRILKSEKPTFWQTYACSLFKAYSVPIPGTLPLSKNIIEESSPYRIRVVRFYTPFLNKKKLVNMTTEEFYQSADQTTTLEFQYISNPCASRSGVPSPMDCLYQSQSLLYTHPGQQQMEILQNCFLREYQRGSHKTLLHPFLNMHSGWKI